MSATRAATPDNAITAAAPRSSPPKPSKNVAGHDRDEVARKVFPHWTKSVTVEEFFQLLADKQRTGNLGLLDDDLKSKENLVEYLNKLSEAVRVEQHSKDKILFRLTESKIPKDHPTGTKCRPDFVAIRISPEAITPEPLSLVTIEESVTGDPQSGNYQKLAWSQLETTGEIFSEGNSEAEAAVQGASYTGYLLQARPDLVSVVGMFFHPKRSHFRVYFTDAWGVCQTNPINFNSTDALPLLRACIRRLYNPEPRLNITRASSFPSKPTFTIDVKAHGQFTGSILIRVGSPFHRRSAIFAVHSSSPTTKSAPLIIKSQYVEKGRRFEEGPILRRIHESYDFPGVVRLVQVTGAKQGPTTVEAESDAFTSSSRESVANPDGETTVAQVRDGRLDSDVTEGKSVAEEGVSSAREDKNAPDINSTTTTTDAGVGWPHDRRDKQTRETLLPLQDKANLLVDAKTPLEALIAFYDLLEVTRFLYKHRNIFHRDISSGNVLLREKGWRSENPFEDKFGDMCFASHLLGEKVKPQASRLHTRVLLIDFDMAEDRGDQSARQATDRSGTPMFMARLVRNSVVKAGSYLHHAMPQLQGFALERYRACIPSRLVEFPKNDYDDFRIWESEEIQYSHKLSYDAESIMWLLLSWAMQVKPAKEDFEDRITHYVWGNLTGGSGTDDPRSYFLLEFPPAVCHPVYQRLDELLRFLCNQLCGYHELGTRQSNKPNPVKMKDEYLHETFQRTILDFIVKMIDEPFMREPISPTRRQKEFGGDMSQSTKTPSVSVKRNHQVMVGEDIQPSDQRDPKKPRPEDSHPDQRLP